eukprot:TRINITY_DN41029_c0_g1_i1.p1 TRINITY_DN41029_c0_g1~~TRINITY_DN41029_c0_g1_i1.p1  ORF type:complete len:408 (-),score=88.98 TRINITY_DN41029_c0_g1_i1:51-1202(-)
MAVAKVIVAVLPVFAAVAWYHCKAQAAADRHLLGQLICITNGLRPMYRELQANNLSSDALGSLVRSCKGQQEMPLLTSDGQYLSSFLVRTCDSFKEAPGWKQRKGATHAPLVSVKEVGLDIAFDRSTPALLQLSEADKEKLLPRWVWDVSVGKAFEEEIKSGLLGSKIAAQPGFEEELARYPLLTQNLTSKRGVGAAWRKEYDVEKSKQSLETVFDYGPGKIWIEPEIWVQPAGASTKFHYDYDPFNLVFQIYGSRRFHVLPPQSGTLAYEAESKVKDYGTRWALPVFWNASTGEVTVDLRPGDVLFLPNGWPHRVTYLHDSIGRAVRSWTQCQALSLYLGRRLCTLSTSSSWAGARMCFDDEHLREYGGLTVLESVTPAASQ